MLYEMTSGHRPFAGQSSSDIIAGILDREPEPLARVAAGTPTELQRIVTKTLRKTARSGIRRCKTYCLISTRYERRCMTGPGREAASMTEAT